MTNLPALDRAVREVTTDHPRAHLLANPLEAYGLMFRLATNEEEIWHSGLVAQIRARYRKIMEAR
jgi:hypothetical protein